MDILKINTKSREELVNVTTMLQEKIKANGWENGLLFVYSPHTTAGMTINEGADPDVARDILNTLKRVIPPSLDYTHVEGNSDAHIKTSLVGSSVQVIVENSQLRLGTWQKIFLAEFDGPRTRTIWLNFYTSPEN
ncbi:MAG: secondary thiamine-phosphate synthase enzyme YjbQ [Desulfonauticus sp.]|nr:secondary thiamine-phosphate synthase enzyme YjbQ [Desulfonauticus sp.]